MSAMIRLRRLRKRRFRRPQYEVEYRPTSQDSAGWLKTTAHPVFVIEKLLGTGDAWALIRAADAAREGSSGGWVTVPELELMTVEVDFRPRLFEGDAQAVGSAAMEWAATGLTVRTVRGRKMRTLGGLFDEFAAALQFPLYFGENADAFDECIAELETLPAGEGYVVVISEPDQVLADTDADALEWLVRSLRSAAAVWARPIDLGEWWDRPAIPFHVVLAGESDARESASARWTTAGASPMSLGRD